ncbi:MAG: NADH-quinone oxidoreductase subunit NuoE [Planctomycetota bacterium]|nr:MAG: NADH-quinone oxidoreductase subunit NuoE [Planctomycetota bacterium]
MAWITKKSATTTIERRDEPYLTSEMRRKLDEDYLPRFEVKKGALLPALHMIQHEYGWIPKQAMLEIAEHLGVPPSEVLDTASFYEEYWLNPKGKHLIQVCRSIACEFCGQREVTEAFKAKLGIDVGETTEDGRYTLVELECLGSCGTAPVALIDETLYENLNADKASRLIDRVNDADAGSSE